MAEPQALRTLKKVQRTIILAVQAFLIPVCLTLVYVIGLGLTWPLALLFAPRKGLGMFVRRSESYWKKAEGYSPDIERCAEPY